MTITQWHQAISHCQEQGLPYVLITQLAAAGSTPREAGCKMVVTANDSYDTIGGGHLEYQVIRLARQLLEQGQVQQRIESFPLASRLGQCCGGASRILLEVICAHQATLAVFGAGHVARALVPILAQLPLRIRWIDSRAEQFPDTVAENVSVCPSDDPVAEIAALPKDASLVILTHNHQLDFDLVRTALGGQFDFIGMIGSETKARRFRHRLAHREFSPAQIERLISPVGLAQIPGKRPIEVAVSIAAQLIQRLYAGQQQEPAQAWRQTRELEQSA